MANPVQVERREQCLHHSGFEESINNLVKQGDAHCKKLDAIKTYMITILGGLVVSLGLQIIKLLGG